MPDVDFPACFQGWAGLGSFPNLYSVVGTWFKQPQQRVQQILVVQKVLYFLFLKKKPSPFVNLVDFQVQYCLFGQPTWNLLYSRGMRTGNEARPDPSTTPIYFNPWTVSYIMQVLCKLSIVLHNKSIIMTHYSPCAVHPMKYFRNDVMWYKSNACLWIH